jgi:hypothetical protein
MRMPPRHGRSGHEGDRGGGVFAESGGGADGGEGAGHLRVGVACGSDSGGYAKLAAAVLTRD